MQTSSFRRVTALVLAIIGCLLAITSVVAVWSRNQILDTDRYLSSVAPLADDPVIQDEIADKVTREITARVDARRAGLGDTIAPVVERQAQALTRSDAFAKLWLEINRIGHRDLVRLLTDDDSGSVAVENGRLTLNLSGVVDAAVDRLSAAGLTVVTSLPPITLVVDVADAEDVEKARTAVTWLDRLSTVLPILSLVVLAASILVRGRVPRPLFRPALMLAASMLVLWIAVKLGAGVAAAQVPSDVASTDAVHAYYRQLTSLLRYGTVTVGIIALIAAALAFGWDLVTRRRPAA